MELITKELRETLPTLYATDGQGDETIVHAKFFTPWGNWRWFVTEFDGDDTCFGLVQGHEIELGYFSISELQSVTGPFGLHVERDIHWEPTPLGEVRQKLWEDGYA